MTKVLMLLQAPFPPDIRVEREIKTLSENGYDVGIICNQYVKKLDPIFSFCAIFRLRAIFNSTKLNKILNFPFFLNPRFIAKTIKVYLNFKPDIIHAHDLPMVPLALLLKRFYKVPVIFDMHESYPDALVAFKKKGIINYLFKNPKFAKILENYCLKIVDEIIVVVEDHKERLIKRGIQGKKISVVSNTVDLEIFKQLSSDPNIQNIYSGRTILLYTGGVSPDRGLEIPVKSLLIIKEHIPNIILLIIGDGSYTNTLTEIAKFENVEEFVQFIHWPGHNQLGTYLDIAHICIIPQPSNDYINSGVPNKFFEYMSQGKPVLAASEPMERIIKETSCGEVFKSGSHEDFAQKIIEMLQSEKQYGENGLRAVKEKYNWEVDVSHLVDLYKSIELENKFE